MVYQKRDITIDSIVHVVNRGVDKRNIFMDDSDYFRFIHDLYEFNDQKSAINNSYRFLKSIDIARQYIKREKRKLLVKILAFCLMPNHYHLLLQPMIDSGVTQFMKKLNMGYAKYFNEKNQRSGALFQGRFKSVKVINTTHFVYLPYYIHLNPLDLVMPEWRDGNIPNYKKAIRFLEKYRWSSHLDYIGRKNFPSITQRAFLMEYFEGSQQYQYNLEEWLKNIELEDVRHLLLEY